MSASDVTIRPRILAVDDERRGVELLVRSLRKLGVVETALSGEEGWEMIQRSDFDLVISDQRMPGLSGVELLARVAERREHTGRILLTGYTDLSAVLDAINCGRVHAYLSKPCAPQDLEISVRAVLERVRLARENESLVVDLEDKNIALQSALHSLESAQKKVIASERLAAVGRLIAMIVHDLRGPLSVIRSAAAATVREGEALDNEDLREIGGDTLEEAERMQRMCAELQEMSRASEGSGNAREEDLDDVVAAAVTPLMIDASHCGIELVLELHSGARVLLDEDRIRRALLNLGYNALEAMPEGGTLRIETSRTEESAQLSVIDSGIGIPEEIRESLFEPFVTSGKARGTGIGLAVVAKVVDDHGGKIEVGKPEGGGTAFTIDLPLAGRDGA